ncbi:unnamed protein product [Pleuronectes platessa]|uniref:Uncharacterized protein n=1 Tax=Pleuronectes platessa TaxID=8262 RepID=A0A9N7VCH5_PLEPL|nr:unnamed protein product [Pleuronectes platessa]
MATQAAQASIDGCQPKNHSSRLINQMQQVQASVRKQPGPCDTKCFMGTIRRQPRRTAGRGPPRERRVPPAGAVAEVIREKGPTRVQSRCRRPPYPVPSNGPPSATDTAPRSKRKKAPRTTDAVRHSGIGPPPPKKRRGVPHAESPAAWRGGRLLPQHLGGRGV